MVTLNVEFIASVLGILLILVSSLGVILKIMNKVSLSLDRLNNTVEVTNTEVTGIKIKLDKYDDRLDRHDIDIAEIKTVQSLCQKKEK